MLSRVLTEDWGSLDFVFEDYVLFKPKYSRE